MLAFFLTFILGVAEMFLLNKVLKYAFAADMKRVLIFVLLKLILYAAVIVPVVLFMKESLIAAAVGFCVGMPGAVIVYTLMTAKKKHTAKGDENVEHSSDC